MHFQIKNPNTVLQRLRELISGPLSHARRALRSGQLAADAKQPGLCASETADAVKLLDTVAEKIGPEVAAIHKHMLYMEGCVKEIQSTARKNAKEVDYINRQLRGCSGELVDQNRLFREETASLKGQVARLTKERDDLQGAVAALSGDM